MNTHQNTQNFTYKKRIGHLYAFITQQRTADDFYYTVSFEKQDRNYCDKPEPASFRFEELLLLGKLVDQVHTNILQVQGDWEF